MKLIKIVIDEREKVYFQGIGIQTDEHVQLSIDYEQYTIMKKKKIIVAQTIFIYAINFFILSKFDFFYVV